MARKRIETGATLQSWDDVDRCLAEIGRIEAGQQESIDQIKAASKLAAEPLQNKKLGLELAIKDYAEANRAEFAKVKNKELTFGVIGFRLSTSVVIKRVAETLQALKDLGLANCIRTKEECDKEAMKQLPLETLHAVGATLRQTDAFGYEVKREALAEVA
ncbi:host-nuclease inhibitor Gam family protein [Thauera aromatica]|uniref:host-nuclease inhibitor Gam family protein n=1 Tax=Thauera aromatica TaxID=59405 RepID=UPI001FFDD2E6|nr:host-nuclease inhibitor Gam family protein [Thauera aromatica]MCK2095660.1 host-nuclease inhibitor Gam family protein [Thauera aromatica]